ncbi:GNAT family N-acetyltransferase, partial [Rhizobium sp. Pop5]
CLYVGKLAVLPAAQGKGLGRRLLAVAEETAAALGLAALRLETRIELTDNHAVFAAWGFERTAEKAHPGFTRTTFIEMRKILAR